WILALSSKQVAIVLPLLLMTYEFLYVPKEQRFLIRNRLLVSGGIILGGALLLAYVLLVVDLENLAASKIFKGYRGELSLYSVAITSGRTFWRYVELLVWPSGLCPDHTVELSRSLFEPTTLLSWGGLIALVALAFLVAHSSPLLAFGIFWFLISYLPISNLIPTSYLLADRYMYIPSAGFCIILVGLGETLYTKLNSFKPRYAIPMMAIVGGLLIVGYSLRTLSYNSYWKNDRILWQYALNCNPQSFRAYSQLGVQHYRAGAYPEAIEDLTKAINLSYHDDYVNRGSAFLEMKNYEAAIEDYNHAIAYRPDWAKAYLGRGLVYFDMGQYEKAIDDYSQAIELQTDYSKAYNNRGLAYENLNRREEALENFLEATRLDPDNGAAHNNLGRALVYAGRLKEAIQSYERAKQLGVTQATKILKFLNNQGLPSDKKHMNPSGPPPAHKEAENLESSMPRVERDMPRSP
ncbi:MAG: tetratricopeptide repeat protein, partial [Nitrospirota bacterium]